MITKRVLSRGLDGWIYRCSKRPGSVWESVPGWNDANILLAPQIVAAAKFLVVVLPMMTIIVDLLPIHIRWIGLEIVSTGNFRSPINFKILYFSALILLLAVIVHWIICPKLVKKYRPDFNCLPTSLPADHLMSDLYDRFLGKLDRKSVKESIYSRSRGDSFRGDGETINSLPHNHILVSKLKCATTDREWDFLKDAFFPTYKRVSSPLQVNVDSETAIGSFVGGRIRANNERNSIRITDIEALRIYKLYYELLNQSYPISRAIFYFMLLVSFLLGLCAFVTLIAQGSCILFDVCFW